MVFPDDGYAHYHPQQDKKKGLGDRICTEKQTGYPNGDRVNAEGTGAAGRNS
nr:hypothetical protein [Microcoleus sp. PH2017_35_SFW_U_B]